MAILLGVKYLDVKIPARIEGLDRAYPRRAYGVVLGFSRIFAVGHKPG